MINNEIINQTFIAKGNLYFFYDTDGINYYINSIDDIPIAFDGDKVVRRER